jgi:hypothetical protein
MPYSEVPRIELNQDGTVTFFVNIGGFRLGTPVEISGYASQTNGATATFRWVEPMPPEYAPGQGAIVVVKSVPVIQGTFTAADPIMVVAKAADVWSTTLNQDTGNQLAPAIVAAKAAYQQLNPRASWNSDGTTYHSMYASTAPSGQPGGMWQKASGPGLAADFIFAPLPPLEHPVEFPFPAINPKEHLGPLAGLAGKWSGEGFNVIWRPLYGQGQNHFLELNMTRELLEFTQIEGPIPNRGFRQPDINMYGLIYLQQISDANQKDANQNPAGLHIEPGLWAVVPETSVPPESRTVARLASIPHGTAIVAQGTACTSAAGPDIPDISIKPFNNNDPSSTHDFAEQTLATPSEFRTCSDGLTGITQAMVDNPNSLLQSAIKGQHIDSTITLHVTTYPEPVAGGGTANTAFLAPNADAVSVTATFWLETIHGETAPSQLQYSQTALLKFGDFCWPHVTVGTLCKQPCTDPSVHEIDPEIPLEARQEPKPSAPRARRRPPPKRSRAH